MSALHNKSQTRYAGSVVVNFWSLTSGFVKREIKLECFGCFLGYVNADGWFWKCRNGSWRLRRWKWRFYVEITGFEVRILVTECFDHKKLFSSGIFHVQCKNLMQKGCSLGNSTSPLIFATQMHDNHITREVMQEGSRKSVVKSFVIWIN